MCAYTNQEVLLLSNRKWLWCSSQWLDLTISPWIRNLLSVPKAMISFFPKILLSLVYHNSRFFLEFQPAQIQIYIYMDFPDGSVAKESACNARDLGLIPGLGRSPLGRHGNTLQYSCLEKPHGQRSLVGYSPGVAELDTTEWLSTHIHIFLIYMNKYTVI